MNGDAGTTKAGRPCKNRALPAARFCRVHAAWSPQAVSLATDTPTARLASLYLEGMLASGLVPLPQLAVYRVVVLMGLGRKGLPASFLKAAPAHLELTGRNVSLETATAMGVIAERMRQLPLIERTGPD